MLVAKDVVFTFKPPAESDGGEPAGAGHVKGSKTPPESKVPAATFPRNPDFTVANILARSHLLRWKRRNNSQADVGCILQMS